MGGKEVITLTPTLNVLSMEGMGGTEGTEGMGGMEGMGMMRVIGIEIWVIMRGMEGLMTEEAIGMVTVMAVGTAIGTVIEMAEI